MNSTYFVGLDLGKRMDHAAVAVLERVATTNREFDPVRYQWNTKVTVLYQVRWMARLRLGTPYPEVVRKVRELLRGLAGLGEVCLVVDASGVGEPVVDMLREEELGATLIAVTITSGGMGVHRGGGVWHVGRVDLLGGLRAMLERSEVRVSSGAPEAERLKREMQALTEGQGRVTSGGREHDDLAMAVALACWWGRMRRERTVEKGAYLPV